MSDRIQPHPGVIVLAAGKGTRMRSETPKVLHQIGGEPLLFHVLSAVRNGLPKSPVLVVTGFGREQVEAALNDEHRFSDLSFETVYQSEQLGTGDAVRVALDTDEGLDWLERGRDILVLPGDQPLMTPALISKAADTFSKSGVIRMVTRDVADPTGYGRVIRKTPRGAVQKIVEESEANTKQKQVCEVATSVYLFQSKFLKQGLTKLSNKNSKGEFYLTDVIAQAVMAKKYVEVLKWEDSDDLLGINNPWELSQAGKILNQRCLMYWALSGVKFLDPANTWVDTTVEISEDTQIGPNTQILGRTRIGKGSTIDSGVVLRDVEIESGVHIKTGTVATESKIESGATLGPYAHLRPNSHVGANCKIGNFVELKNSTIGPKTAISHLSYVGDAEVGREVNIGCGFVTCNYDGRTINGRRKHPTIIEDHVFMGSDCQTVAPVKIGEGAYVASGSTINKDVPAGDMAIARSRQVNKPGYAKRLRGNSSQTEMRQA